MTDHTLSNWELLRIYLNQPEYIHVVLHGLPVYGLAFAVLAGVVALFFGREGSRKAEVVALVLMLAGALSAWPVAHYGGEAYDRVSTMADVDKVGLEWLDVHMDRVDAVMWLFWTTAALAALALVLPIKWTAVRRPLFLLTLAGAIAASAAGGWIAYAGGKIRHKEFRHTPPPVTKQ